MNPYRMNDYDPGTVEIPTPFFRRRMPAWLGALIILCVASGVRAQTGPLRINGLKFGQSDFSVYAMNYCTKADGIIDNTTCLQAAITAVSATGGTLYIPAGTYKITTALLVPAASSNVDILGAGNKTIIAPSSLGSYAIGFSNCTNCSIKNMKIAGSMAEGVFIFQGSQTRIEDLDISGATLSGSLDTAGVLLQDAVDVWISRVYAHGNGGAGAIQGTDIGTYGGSTTNKNITIKDCKATSTAVAINIGLFNTSHSLVEGSYATGAILNNGSTTAGGYGIMFYKTGGAVEWGQNRVIGNHVEATQGSGIYMQCQPSSTVSANRVTGAATTQLNTALQVGGIAIGSCGASTTTGNTVSGNTVTGGPQAGISAGGEDVTIVGNKIDGTTDAGIILRDFHKGTVGSNTIKNTGGGIVSWLSRSGGSGDALDNVSITGNTIYAPGIFATNAQPGIWLSGVNQFVASNNEINNPQGHGILVDAGSSYVSAVGNGIYNIGQSSDNVFSGIKVTDSTYVRAKENQIAGARQKFGVEATGTSDNLVVAHNHFALGHATYTVVGNSTQIDQRAASTATAIPTVGTWSTGDIVWNTTPSSGGTLGWVCTAGGSPGTWKVIAGAIDNVLTNPTINGVTSSGSTAIDLSGNSGVFKPPTGANTFGGSSNTFTNQITIPAGTGTQTGSAPLTIYKNTTPVSSVTTGETDAQSYTLPANTLSADGQKIKCHAQWVHAANANSTTYKIYAFGTQLTAQVLSTSGGYSDIELNLVRTSSTTVGYQSAYETANAGWAGNQAALSGLNFTTTNIIKTSVTGATTNGDLTANYMRCEWWP